MRPGANRQMNPAVTARHQRCHGSMFADLHFIPLFRRHLFAGGTGGASAAVMGWRPWHLTDHDTVEGCARMAQACEASGIEFIPGTELTAELEGNEMHMLGYLLRYHTIPGCCRK